MNHSIKQRLLNNKCFNNTIANKFIAELVSLYLIIIFLNTISFQESHICCIFKR